MISNILGVVDHAMSDRKTPTIYYKFKAKDKDSDEVIDYRIQDLPEELYEAALELYLKDFLPDEILAVSRGLHKKPSAVEDISKMWRSAMEQGLILSCFRDNDIENEEIVAVNILYVSSKHDKNETTVDFKSQDAKDVVDALEYTFQKINVYDMYGVDEFLGGLGLVVNSKYRGRGIATEMLKARRPFLKATGLQLTSTSFTASASQKAAEKAGYEENFAISYLDLAKISPRFTFSKDSSKIYKILSLKL